jgi:F0F1-type ATP synthase delta subunit
MAEGIKEYNVDDLLTNLTSPKKSGKASLEPSEYDVNDLFTNLQPYSASEQPVKSGGFGQNVLKGMEYFSKGGPVGAYMQSNAIAPDAAQKFIKPLQEMSIEDWKQHSLLAPMIEYSVGTMYPGSGFDPEKAKEQLIQKGKAFYQGGKEFLSNPVESLGNVVQAVAQNPYGVAGEVVKSTIYDPEQIGVGAIGAKVAGKAISPVKDYFVKSFEDAKANLAPKPVVAEAPVVAPSATSGGAPGIVPATPKMVEVFDPATGKPVVAAAPEVAPTAPTVAPAAAPVVQPTRNISVLDENPPRPTAPATPEKVTYNEQVLRDVGLEDIRQSALTGDPLEASSQYITSKADKGPYAQGIRNQIELEKNTLGNHFGSIESELGGTVPRRGTSFEISDEMGRGKTVKDALESAQQAHKAKTTELYNKASEEVGAVPVELGGFKEFLDKKSNFVKDSEKSLRNGVDDYLSEQGLLNPDKTVKPMTVGQSEKLRQFINDQYDHTTSKKIGELVGRIDDDVFSNVKGQTYEQARAHFRAGKEIYDNPKAIKDLLGDEGVNQKIADEKVMNRIGNVDQSQFNHLMTTLRDTGKTDAIKEIQTALVNRVKEAGRSEITEPWNARAAAKERAKLSEKLNVAFADNPQLLDKIDKGIEAGNILYIPNKYPGAAVQTNLLHGKFADFMLRKTPTAIGGWIGGGPGAVGGEMLGEKLSNAAAVSRQRKMLQKEIKSKGTPLNEVDEFKIKD